MKIMKNEIHSDIYIPAQGPHKTLSLGQRLNCLFGFRIQDKIQKGRSYAQSVEKVY